MTEVTNPFLRELQILWLAGELFQVRNRVLDEQYPWISVTRSLDDPAHRAVYTALATYIIDFKS